MNNKVIFVSIASYKDPLLINTLNSLYDNADNPQEIRTVVFNQTDFKINNDHLLYNDDRNIEIYSLDFRNTRGVSWARNKIQSFIDNEQYYMQIDAHMEFAKSWDTNLKLWLSQCNAHKPAISFYPPAFDLENGKQLGGPVKNEPRALNMKAITSAGIGLSKELCDLYNGNNKPIPGTTFAAGFTFADIEYAKEVGYDPKLYWNYEESDQTLRAFTHGWVFFGTPEQVIWHKYNIDSTPSHFHEAKDGHGLENNSNAHAENKHFSGTYKGDYSLGDVRTLKEFEILNNINFEKKTLVNPKPKKDLLIIVPYRDREEHLQKYLELTPKYFDNQNVTYDILITELDPVGDWNAGLVCNSLVNFVKKADYKYLYIHHVDVYPISGKWVFPEDNEIFTNIGDVGSCLTTLYNFFKVGGYRNTFWGWGAEDDDLYKKMWEEGIKVTNIEESNSAFNVEFDTVFQEHERKFVGVNYSHNVALLKIKPDRNTNSIFDTNKYGFTHSLEHIRDNIYRQKIKPLVKSARETKNTNLVLGVVYDIDHRKITPFTKTASLVGTGKFDTVILDMSNTKNDTFTTHAGAYGAKVISQPGFASTDPFIERFIRYRDYLLTVDYENIILTDLMDVYFQDNPFQYLENIPEGYIAFNSEGITIEDSDWNRETINAVYNNDIIYEAISPYEVLCCGVIAGKKTDILNFIEVFLQEVNNVWENTPKGIRGVDQPIINKLIYFDQTIKTHTLRIEDAYCVHLHPIIYDPDKCRFTKDINFSGSRVQNLQLNKPFSIVHQYNRDNELYTRVTNHYKEHFSLINL